MALQLLKRQLRAAQKFLDGVKSLPNSSEIVIRQYGELSRFLAKVDNLSTDVSGRLLSLELVTQDLNNALPIEKFGAIFSALSRLLGCPAL